MKVVYSLRHRAHHPQRELESSGFQEPFERPERAEIIRAALAADGAFEFVAPDDWGLAPIEAVHDERMVAFLETAWAEYNLKYPNTHDVIPDVFALPAIRDGMGPHAEPVDIGMRLGWWCYETTTPLTHGTYDAARSSVDVALTAARLVVDDGERAAYGLCRPPGHHAARAVYGGYCFFNNAAIAAHHIAATTGGKVSVLDVDYHHGNGTQQIFYGRPDVQFVSIHADPQRAYPYLTGHRDENGIAEGAGATSNFPLDEAEDEDYLDVLEAACGEIDRFGPDVVVVSLGLDTFWDDPICDFNLTTDCFEACGSRIGELGRAVVVLQEGGYATDDLGENARRWLTGLASGLGGVTAP